MTESGGMAGTNVCQIELPKIKKNLVDARREIDSMLATFEGLIATSADMSGKYPALQSLMPISFSASQNMRNAAIHIEDLSRFLSTVRVAA